MFMKAVYRPGATRIQAMDEETIGSARLAGSNIAWKECVGPIGLAAPVSHGFPNSRADPPRSSILFWLEPRHQINKADCEFSGTAAQIVMTVSILLGVTFLLGFIADPIINIYLDPYGALSPLSHAARYEAFDLEETESSSWLEHFSKGLASLGLLGFLKVIFASPWRMWNLRSSGVRSGRAGSSGRERLADVGWVVIIVGVCTFLVVSLPQGIPSETRPAEWSPQAVWKAVSSWSRRSLERAGERVMDVQADDDEND